MKSTPLRRTSSIGQITHVFALCLLAASLALSGPYAVAQEPDRDIWLVVETARYVLDAHGLRVPGYALSDVPGAPQLPIWTTVIEIPEDADWSIVEVGSEERILSAPGPLPSTPVTELHLSGPADSVSPEVLAQALSVETRPDAGIYRVDALYPAQVVQAGPEGTARGKRLLPVKVYPFQYNPVTGSLRYRPRIEFAVQFTPRRTTSATGAVEAPAPPASDAPQPGIRVSTGDRGIYRLTYAALTTAGLPATGVDPSQLAMWYLGEPVDIEVTGPDDGRFGPGDAVVFYAEPYAGRYMTQNMYRLTWSGPASRMRKRSAAPALARTPATTILRRTRVEYDRQYLPAFHDLARDADHFFDNALYPLASRPEQAVTYTLSLENPVPEGDAQLQVSVHGGRDARDRNPDQSLALRLNGATLGTYRWDGSVSHIVSQTISATSLVPGVNTLMLEAALNQLPGIDYYYIYPNWAEIAYPARAKARDNRLYVETEIASTARGSSTVLYLPLVLGGNYSGQSGARRQENVTEEANDLNVDGFTEGDIRVYDVTDARRPVRLTEAKETTSSDGYSVTLMAGPHISFYLTTPEGFLTPAALQYDEPSSLRSPANNADYIAVVHRTLWDAVQPLLEHRSGQGLRVAKVDIQDVYDEFSGGRIDPEALRAFLSYAYHNWNAGGSPPQYVLLVGDGHFDFKGSARPDLPNLVPPYLLDIDPFIGETAADNRYVSVDGEDDFLPDMALGRIPAKSPADVTAVVDKILTYEDNATSGAWQRKAVFVADNKDDAAYDFHDLSEQVRTTLPLGYDTTGIYYNASSALDTSAEMKTAVKSAFDRGAVYLQWFGHASRVQWGKDRVWELDDAANLARNSVWPLTAEYSCWAGYFINVQGSGQYGNSEEVLAEAMLLAPKKASLADFSPSGLHVGSALVTLDKALTDALFTHRMDRVGLAVNAAKVGYFGEASGAYDVIDTQLLFGDPATQLKLP